MLTAVVAVSAAAVLAVSALVVLGTRARYERRLEAMRRSIEEYTRTLSWSLERVAGRAKEAREQGIRDLELILDLDELLDHLVAEAAARTGAPAVAIRVEGPEGTPVVASFGPDEGRALLELAPLPTDARPFRAVTIGWTYGAALEGEGSPYRSALVVPIVEEAAQTGALVACAVEAEAFRPEHVRSLQALATEAAPGIASARRYAEAERQSVTDSLTGIRNRRGYEVELDREVAKARRSRRPLSLLVLHLDAEKAARPDASDRNGGSALPELAALLARVARATDIPCRPRDDEFAVLLPDTKGAGARRFYARLRHEAGNAFTHGAPMTVSVGLVEWHANETSEAFAARGAAAVARGTTELFGEPPSIEENRTDDAP